MIGLDGMPQCTPRRMDGWTRHGEHELEGKLESSKKDEKERRTYFLEDGIIEEEGLNVGGDELER